MTGSKIRNLQRQDYNSCILASCFYQDHALGVLKVITAGSIENGQFQVWDLSARRLSVEYKEETAVSHLQIHSVAVDSPPLVVIGYVDGKARIYDMLTHSLLVTLAGHKSRINQVCVANPPVRGSIASLHPYRTEQYDLLVGTCSNDNMAMVWKVVFDRVQLGGGGQTHAGDSLFKGSTKEMYECYRILRHTSAVSSIVFFVHGMDSGDPITATRQSGVVFSPDQMSIITGCEDDHLPRMWPLTGVIPVKELSFDPTDNKKHAIELGKREKERDE